MAKCQIAFVHWDSKFQTVKGFYNSCKVKYFTEKGHEVTYLTYRNLSVEEWIDKLKPFDHVFMYNGSRPESKSYRLAAQELGKDVTYYEGGILPALAHEYHNREGILGNSSLCRDISWVTDEMVEQLFEWKKTYIHQLGLKQSEIDRIGHGEYIFCPMQCSWDANFSPEFGWSPFEGKDAMNQFIKHVQRHYPNDQIIFRCHPADMDRFDQFEADVKDGNHIIPGHWSATPKKSDAKLLREMMGAKKVVGINSTSLLQSELFGIPTEALGYGYIQAADKMGVDRIRMVTATWKTTYRHNDPVGCERVIDLIHKKGEVCWRR